MSLAIVSALSLSKKFLSRVQLISPLVPAMNPSNLAQHDRSRHGERRGIRKPFGSVSVFSLPLAIAMASVLPTRLSAEDTDVRVTQIAAGTQLDGDSIEGWTDRVLIAHPRVAAGDFDQIGSIIKDNAELFSFVVLARVERPRRDSPAPHANSNPASPAESNPASPADSRPTPADSSAPPPAAATTSGTPPAVLSDIGVGLATQVEGRLQVVSGPPAKPGSVAAASRAPDLGFISGQVLRTAAESLNEMRLVARRSTLVMYDSPAVVLIADRNTEATVRSLIWVEADSGRLHHMLWVMQRGRRQHWMPGLEFGVYLKVPLVEDRVLHVEADRVTFGIPSATAIGLSQLPPGYRFSLAGELGELACRSAYDEASLAQLAAKLVAALRESNPPAE